MRGGIGEWGGREVALTENEEVYSHKNVSFSSPSSAGMFVLGGSINGWTEWKNKEGKTLDELLRKS